MASVISLMGPAKVAVKSKRCGRCDKPVYANEQVYSNGKYWHRLCYKCKVCKTKLTSQTIAHMEGEIYCEGCHCKKFGITGYGHGSGAGILRTDKIADVMPVTGVDGPKYQERDAYSISVVQAVNRPEKPKEKTEYSSAYTPKEQRKVSVGAFSAKAKIVEYEQTVIGVTEQMICMDCGAQYTVDEIYFCDHCGGSLELVQVEAQPGEETGDGTEPQAEPEPQPEPATQLKPPRSKPQAPYSPRVGTGTYCESCGAPGLAATAKFCTECGAKRK